jgi:hypothetical protein
VNRIPPTNVPCPLGPQAHPSPPAVAAELSAPPACDPRQPRPPAAWRGQPRTCIGRPRMRGPQAQLKVMSRGVRQASDSARASLAVCIASCGLGAGSQGLVAAAASCSNKVTCMALGRLAATWRAPAPLLLDLLALCTKELLVGLAQWKTEAFGFTRDSHKHGGGSHISTEGGVSKRLCLGLGFSQGGWIPQPGGGCMQATKEDIPPVLARGSWWAWCRCGASGPCGGPRTIERRCLQSNGEILRDGLESCGTRGPRLSLHAGICIVVRSYGQPARRSPVKRCKARRKPDPNHSACLARDPTCKSPEPGAAPRCASPCTAQPPPLAPRRPPLTPQTLLRPRRPPHAAPRPLPALRSPPPLDSDRCWGLRPQLELRLRRAPPKPAPCRAMPRTCE